MDQIEDQTSSGTGCCLFSILKERTRPLGTQTKFFGRFYRADVRPHFFDFPLIKWAKQYSLCVASETA